MDGLELEAPCSASDKWFLISSSTRERIELPAPAGRWSLELQDGFGVVADNGREDHFVFPEDILRRLLCAEDTEGAAIYVVARILMGKVQRMTLWSFLTDHKNVVLKMTSGASRGEHTFTAAVLRTARPDGPKVYWRVNDLYTILGMRSYKNKASKWSWTTKPRWITYFSEVGLDESHVLESTSKPGEDREDVGDRNVEADRFLPFVGVSTVGMFLLLLRFGTRAPAHGGLKEEGPREAALELFKAFVETGKYQKPKTIPVHFDKGVMAWPGIRNLHGDVAVTFENGKFLLKPLWDLGKTEAAPALLREIMAITTLRYGELPPEVPAESWTMTIFKKASHLDYIVAQLLHGVALRAEANYYADLDEAGG